MVRSLIVMIHLIPGFSGRLIPDAASTRNWAGSSYDLLLETCDTVQPRRAIRLPTSRSATNNGFEPVVPVAEIDPILTALAEQVRSLYCACMREYTGDPGYGTRAMPQWDGDAEGKHGRRSTPVWPRIAHCILRTGADPYQFIRAQFFVSKSSKPPAPNMMYSDAAVAKYAVFKDYARKEIEQRVGSADNQVFVHTLPLTKNLGWPYEKALDYVLRDETVRITPLVRYCYAVAAGLAIASQFREAALCQYVFQVPEYDAVLQQRIPGELRETAIRYRNHFVRNV